MHPQVILTSAGCVTDPSGAPAPASRLHPVVHIGGYTLQWDLPAEYDLRQAVRTVLHPQYNATTREYDAALLLLDSPSQRATVALAAALGEQEDGGLRCCHRRPSVPLSSATVLHAAEGPQLALNPAFCSALLTSFPSLAAIAAAKPALTVAANVSLLALGWGAQSANSSVGASMLQQVRLLGWRVCVIQQSYRSAGVYAVATLFALTFILLPPLLQIVT